MDSKETPQQPPEESLTFTIKSSRRNVFFAKVIMFLILTLAGGYFYGQEAAREYERGRELTREKYLEKYDEYKGELLSFKDTSNPIVSTFTILLVLSFLIGSYELTALAISFIIGKVIRR
jgi:hypothetical protein